MCVATLFAASGALPLSQDVGFQLSTTNGPVGGLSPDPTNYLGHAHVHTPPPAQKMLVAECNAMPNFDQMETVHRKVSKYVDVIHCSDAGGDSGSLYLDVNDANTSLQANCLIMGGCDQMSANYMELLESAGNGLELETTEGEAASREEPAIATTIDDTSTQSVNSKMAWPKFEDGLLLLLNLMASITWSSSKKSISTQTPSSPESGRQSPVMPGTSSTPPSTHGSMDSETMGLSKVQIELTSSSCQDCQQNVLWNVSSHWFNSCNESWPQECLVDGTVEYLTTARNPQLSPSLKHNVTMHYSQDEAVSVDTTKWTCASRSSRPATLTSSPNLNIGQLAVDLHWQSGGTGETDQSGVSRRFNSTPLILGQGDFMATEFTLTENLLIYANSLLTMAF